MANWMNVSIYFFGEQNKIDELFEYIKSDEGTFDFNKVIQMPKDIEDAPNLDDTYMYVRQYIKTLAPTERAMSLAIVDKYYNTHLSLFSLLAGQSEAKMKKAARELGRSVVDIGKQFTNNIIKYGCATRAAWTHTYWGGNRGFALEANVVKNSIHMSFPHGGMIHILRNLSITFPDVKMRVYWLNRQEGSICRFDVCQGEYKNYICGHVSPAESDLAGKTIEDEWREGPETKGVDIV